MNKTKRGLELGSAITSIVLNGLVALLVFIAVLFSSSMGDLLVEMISSTEPELSTEITRSMISTMIALLIVVGVFCVVNVVLASILCIAPAQDGKGGYKRRLGISITHICLNGVICLFLAGGILLLLVYIAIIVLGIVSVCLKHPGISTFENSSPKLVDDRIAELNRMKNAGFITEEEYNTALAHVYTTAESSVKEFTVEEKLAELKKCKEMGVITEEQYEVRVKEIIENI